MKKDIFTPHTAIQNGDMVKVIRCDEFPDKVGFVGAYFRSIYTPHITIRNNDETLILPIAMPNSNCLPWEISAISDALKIATFAVAFTKEEISSLSINDRARLFLMKWKIGTRHYFNMSMNDDNWRELGWAINKEEFKTLMDYGKVILNDKGKTTLKNEDLKDFLSFHGF